LRSLRERAAHQILFELFEQRADTKLSATMKAHGRRPAEADHLGGAIPPPDGHRADGKFSLHLWVGHELVRLILCCH
jgi:hypothetical protein